MNIKFTNEHSALKAYDEYISQGIKTKCPYLKGGLWVLEYTLHPNKELGHTTSKRTRFEFGNNHPEYSQRLLKIMVDKLAKEAESRLNASYDRTYSQQHRGKSLTIADNCIRQICELTGFFDEDRKLCKH